MDDLGIDSVFVEDLDDVEAIDAVPSEGGGVGVFLATLSEAAEPLPLLAAAAAAVALSLLRRWKGMHVIL